MPDNDNLSSFNFVQPLQSNDAERRLNWKRLHLSKSKLKATSRTSALLSGFAMVILVESDTSKVMNQGLLIAFSICTTLVVAVHLLALMISTCILPNIEGISALNDLSLLDESPHMKMHYYIDIAWMLSTFIGILLFLIDIAILSWLRFQEKTFDINYPAIFSTVIMVPAIIIFIVFSVIFYRELITHRIQATAKRLEEIDNLFQQRNVQIV